MKTLNIHWKRLVSDGDTCPRCGSTEDELDEAVSELKKKLEPDIKVTLKKSELSLEEFNKNPIESNRILFDGKSLESLLNGKTGSSKCCDVCGDKECRTVELNGEKHEVITAEMIVEAGLKVIKLA